MALQKLLYTAALVSVTVFLTSQVVLQGKDVSHETQPPQPVEPGSGDSESDSESMVENWVRYAMPGKHHKLLRKMAGKWNLAVKYRMSAETPIVESEGTCERKWILGKRFLLEEFDGGSLALPFQGMAIYGYDSFEQKYTSVWVDTTNNAVTTSFGVCEDSCNVIAFTGQHGDPWTGVKRKSRGVTRFIDANKHVLELHEAGSDGKEFKILEITYTKKVSGRNGTAGFSGS